MPYIIDALSSLDTNSKDAAEFASETISGNESVNEPSICPVPNDRKVHHKSDHEQQASILYSINYIPHKGHGVLATSAISAGTLIMSEAPLVVIREPSGDTNLERHHSTVTAGLAKSLAIASTEARSDILALHNAHEGRMPKLAGILQTNGFDIGDNHIALFRDTCRINHACLPNISAEWNSNTSRMEVRANRDLFVGEELTFDYTGRFWPSSERQRHLKVLYGFDCACDLCSLPPDLKKVSDVRRQVFNEYEELVVGKVFEAPETCLNAARSMLGILKQEDMTGGLWERAWYLAAQIAIESAHGDVARGSTFARRAYETGVMHKGNNNPETIKMREIMQHPERHAMYGDSFAWQTSLDDKPQDASEEQFDQWLWRLAV